MPGSSEDQRRWTAQPLIVAPDFLPVSLDGAVLTGRDRIVRYEQMIREHGRIPYVLIRLAEDLEELHASGSALSLYEEVQAELAASDIMDDALNDVVDRLSEIIEDDGRSSLMASYSGGIKYVQQWKPTQSYIFPATLRAPPEGHEDVRSRWQTLYSSDSGSDLGRRYLTEMAIETNHVESTFLLTEKSVQNLIIRGVEKGDVVCDARSEIQDPLIVRNILNDTAAAYELAASLTSDDVELTPEAICDVHRRLLRTVRFESSSYPCPGDTRSTTRATVHIFIREDEAVQFCPYPKVDDELEALCYQAHRLQQHMNPFAVASWLHLVLAQCHPFNDGNGRVARFIASLPLLKAGYPPINISLPERQRYFDAIHGTHRGNYEPMAECLLDGMRLSMARVSNLDANIE